MIFYRFSKLSTISETLKKMFYSISIYNVIYLYERQKPQTHDQKHMSKNSIHARCYEIAKDKDSQKA